MRSYRVVIALMFCMMFLSAAVISQDASPIRTIVLEDAVQEEAHSKFDLI